MNIRIYTLTSPLHDPDQTDRASQGFINGIEEASGRIMPGLEFIRCGELDADNPDVSCDEGISVIHVRTGGTEELFIRNRQAVSGKVWLLASGMSNSLAASMEILSYLRSTGGEGEILHGSAEAVSGKLCRIAVASEAAQSLRGMRAGVLGKPSDWLIASAADRDAVLHRLGVELVDVPMQEVIGEIGKQQSRGKEAAMAPDSLDISGEYDRNTLAGALAIYFALKEIVSRYNLRALTIRCFDLLGPVRNTGCLALAMLNRDGVVSGCEGDIPAMLTMTIAHALTGSSGFQANPSRFDSASGSAVFAHCTVPLDMVREYRYDSHFESGIGVAIKGLLPEGDITVFKVSGDLKRFIAEEGVLSCNIDSQQLCRTQVEIHPDRNGIFEYFLNNPIGNHHIILRGRHRDLIETFFSVI